MPPSLSILWNRAVASDPGFSRLMLAVRVTVAVMLTTLVLCLFTQALHLPTAFALLGSVTALQVSLSVNDPQARVTTMLTIVPAAIGVTLGSLLSSYAFASDFLFLVVLFISVAIRAHGPRWTALGIIAVVTYFFTLFLGVTTTMLPALLAAVFGGVACSFFVRFVIFPDRPRWIAERTVKAFKARAYLTATAAYDLLRADGPALSARQKLAAATTRLNETAVSIEARLGAEEGQSLRSVFDVELATEELAAAAMRLRESDAAVPRVLRLALLAMSREQSARAATLAAAPLHGAAASDKARALAEAIVNVEHALRRIDAVAGVLSRSDAPWGFGPGRQQPALRQAIQITLASTAAIVVGAALSPEHRYWAVLAAFFVFTGTASSGETIVRAWSRIIGTTMGVGIGVIAAPFAQHHALLSVAAMFFCLFSGVYLLRLSYGTMIFFITALLSMLYAELGNFQYALLGVRLEETVVGALCGALAAGMILPTRTNDVIRTHEKEALAAVGTAVHASIAELTDRNASGSAMEAARDAEDRVQQLILRAKPGLFWSPFFAERDTLRRRIIALSACGYHTRVLAREVHRYTEALPNELLLPLLALEARLQEHIRAAGRRIDGNEAAETDDMPPIFEELRRDATPVLGAALETLQYLDHAVTRLARNDSAAS